MQAHAASRISSRLKGKTKQFGWLRAPATKIFFPFSNIHEPRNHPNCQILERLPLRGTGAARHDEMF